MSDTIVKPTLDHTNRDDEDEMAHYVNKAASTAGYVHGLEVEALCGKIWIPSKDPESKEICPRCVELYEELPDTTG